MAISKGELQRWLETLEDGVLIAVDEGGLALCASDTAGQFADEYEDEPYLEVGGIPEES